MTQKQGTSKQQNKHDSHKPRSASDTPKSRIPNGSSRRLPEGEEQTRSVRTFRSISTLRSLVSLHHVPGSGSLDKATFIAAAVGAFSALGCTIAGYVWAGLVQDSTEELLIHHSACILSELDFDEAIGISPWNFISPQWVFCIFFVGAFALRKYVLPLITDALYDDLTDMKKEKVSNYMLEIIGTTAALVLCSLLGFWKLLFQPETYSDLSPGQAYNLALGGNIMMCCFTTTYSLELAFDQHMRFGLALHHWTAIGLTLLATPALYNLRGDVYTVRAFFALSLYMSTEQNVFIEMLMYHRQIYWPRVYYASAVYYALTRLVVTVLSLWTWRKMYDSISTIPHHSGLVYSLWLIFLPANMVLNFTQAHTVASMLGIARSVAKKVAMDQPLPKKSSLVIPSNMSCASFKSNASIASAKACKDLGRTFHVIDFDDSGRMTLENWREHISGMEGELLLPRSAVNRSFDAIDTSQKGFVTYDEFEQFFQPFVIRHVDFERVMLAVILKVAIDSGAYGPVEQALRYEHSQVMSEIQHQYHQSIDHSMPGDDTLFHTALERLCVKDEATSLEIDLSQQAHVLQASFAHYCSELYRIMPASGP